MHILTSKETNEIQDEKKELMAQEEKTIAEPLDQVKEMTNRKLRKIMNDRNNENQKERTNENKSDEENRKPTKEILEKCCDRP